MNLFVNLNFANRIKIQTIKLFENINFQKILILLQISGINSLIKYIDYVGD
jgi:hypothetical protein